MNLKLQSSQVHFVFMPRWSVVAAVRQNLRCSPQLGHVRSVSRLMVQFLMGTVLKMLIPPSDPPTGVASYLPPAAQLWAMSITLYALDGCPWCVKVHDALEEHGIEYDTIWMEALHSDRDEVARVSNQRAVPVLVDEDHGVTMGESANILAYIEHTLA